MNFLYGFEKIIMKHDFGKAMLEVFCNRENPITIPAAVNYLNLISHCDG